MICFLPQLKVNNVKGRINGRNIQCQFDATVPDSTNAQTKAATDSTSFSMSVSTGTYNASKLTHQHHINCTFNRPLLMMVTQTITDNISICCYVL